MAENVEIKEQKFSIVEISFSQDWKSAQEASKKIDQLVSEGYVVTRSGPVVIQLFSKEANRFLTRLQKEIS